jgi:hypothetical protein
MPKMAPPSSIDFSPQASLWLHGPHDQPLVRQQDYQVGTQPELCTWNPHHDEPSGQRRSSRDLKGSLAGKPKSHVRSGPLLQPFQASADALKNTPEEWRNVAAHYTISTRTTQLHPAPSSGREASPDVAIQDAEEGTKGGKKRHKPCCQEVATDDDRSLNKHAGGLGVWRIMEVTGSSKRQARPPMDHFEKLLEEACPNHAYPIKDKLKDCNLMKSFMASGSLS